MRSTTAISTRATRVMRSITGRSFQNGRPSVDLVDPVHRPAERPDVAGGRPQRPARPTTRASPAPASCEIWRSGGSMVPSISAETSGSSTSSTVSTDSSAWPDQPEQGGQRDGGREDRQHRVVGQGRGEVGALVVGELPQRLARRRRSRTAWSGRWGCRAWPASSGRRWRLLPVHGAVGVGSSTGRRHHEQDERPWPPGSPAAASTSGRGLPSSVVARSLRSATLSRACDFTSSLAVSWSTVSASCSRWAAISASSSARVG